MEGRALLEKLTLHYLRLRNYSGKVHVVPNAISTVGNMTRGAAYAVANITVAHGEDVDRVLGARRAVGQAMQQNLRFAARIPDELEIAGVGKWADSALVIRCCFRVAPPEQWCVRREYLRKLTEAFGCEGIETRFRI